MEAKLLACQDAVLCWHLEKPNFTTHRTYRFLPISKSLVLLEKSRADKRKSMQGSTGDRRLQACVCVCVRASWCWHFPGIAMPAEGMAQSWLAGSGHAGGAAGRHPLGLDRWKLSPLSYGTDERHGYILAKALSGPSNEKAKAALLPHPPFVPLLSYSLPQATTPCRWAPEDPSSPPNINSHTQVKKQSANTVPDTTPIASNKGKTVPAESHAKKLDALNTVQVCKQHAVHQSWWHLGDSGPIFFPQWFFKYEFTSQQVLNCQEVTEIVHWNTNTSSTKYSCFMGTKFKLCCENWP